MYIIYVCMNEYMYVCTCTCMYVCMYVCMYTNNLLTDVSIIGNISSQNRIIRCYDKYVLIRMCLLYYNYSQIFGSMFIISG